VDGIFRSKRTMKAKRIATTAVRTRSFFGVTGVCSR